jgi:Flp pilus assembly protein TadD
MTRTRLCLVVAVAAVVGLAGRGSAATERISREMLLRAEPLGAESEPAAIVEQSDILAASPQMRGFVDEHVNPGATDRFKLQQLIDAIMNRTTFGLEYDETTRTAAETFRERRGNCLSFSSMFVSLARLAELSVFFEEVEIPPDWSLRRDTFVLSRHVNVKADLGGGGGVHVVDFNIGDFKTTYEVRTISDRRAAAHFYNNLGVERMQNGDTVLAVALFRRAIEVDDDRFSPAWTNLGTLYRRNGHLEHAEAAYLKALQEDKRDLVAMSNLVALYEKIGDHDRAAVYRKKVDEHRMRNPYYRFRLAEEAFYERDFDAAIEHLKYATRKNKDEDRFFFLLGLCHLMKGNEDEARRWMSKAEELAINEPEKNRYSTKIEALMSASEEVN